MLNELVEDTAENIVAMIREDLMSGGLDNEDQWDILEEEIGDTLRDLIVDMMSAISTRVERSIYIEETR